jgi:hypothetical protein
MKVIIFSRYFLAETIIANKTLYPMPEEFQLPFVPHLI